MEWDHNAEEQALQESIEWQKYCSSKEGQLEILEYKNMFELETN